MKTHNSLKNMRNFIVLAILMPVVASCNSGGPTYYTGKHTDWEATTVDQPYLENGKITQNQQWAAADWYVQDWVSQHKNENTLVNGFYRADIIRKQTAEDQTPVLVVGPQFYRLGGFDKRRVLTTMDAVYGITRSGQQIVLRDWHTDQDIGVFTKDGLQLE